MRSRFDDCVWLGSVGSLLHVGLGFGSGGELLNDSFGFGSMSSLFDNCFGFGSVGNLLNDSFGFGSMSRLLNSMYSFHESVLWLCNLRFWFRNVSCFLVSRCSLNLIRWN